MHATKHTPERDVSTYKWSCYATAMVIVVLVGTRFVFAADWSSCAYELERLQRAARDASYVAQELDQKGQDYESCKTYPDTYDLLEDQCESKRYAYQRAANDLESSLDTVDSRIRSMSSSCGLDRKQVPSSGDPICDLYRGYKGQFSDEALLNICIKSNSEAMCRKCLGI
jgi:hypothetical protein